MKMVELSATLLTFSDMLDRAGAARGGRELRAIALALKEGGNASVAASVAKVSNLWTAQSKVADYPETLAMLVDDLKAGLTQAGSMKAATDLGTLANLFIGRPTGEIAVFAEALQSAILQPAPRKRREQTKGGKAVDVAYLEELSRKLVSASSESSEFDELVTTIGADRTLKKGDVQRIANQYLGETRNFKSRSDALEAIRRRQAQDAIQASREKRMDKIAV